MFELQEIKSVRIRDTIVHKIMDFRKLSVAVFKVVNVSLQKQIPEFGAVVYGRYKA